MTSASFAKMLTQEADTKRHVYKDGKYGEPAVYLTNVKCTPITSASAEIGTRDTLDTPHELFEVFTESADIEEGHLFVYGAKDYPIRSVADFLFQGETFLRLTLEELKA